MTVAVEFELYESAYTKSIHDEIERAKSALRTAIRAFEVIKDRVTCLELAIEWYLVTFFKLRANSESTEAAVLTVFSPTSATPPQSFLVCELADA